MDFITNIKQRAKQDKKVIVLPETTDKRVLEAASIAIKEEIADIILIGSKNRITATAQDLDLSGARIIDPANCPKFNEYVELLVELRKSKGMTYSDAEKLLINNPLYFGCIMVKAGDADGMVAGAINSSADVLRAALQVLKTKPGTQLVSAFFVMVVPDCEYGSNGTFIFSDAGLNQSPDMEQIACIAESSADSFKLLVEDEPRVALMCHSTKGSAKHPEVDKMRNATALVRSQRPDILVDGELQADAALVPEIAASKAPGSPIEGRANVLIFPDLDAANIGYKLVARLAKAQAYGPITQGIAKPVNDLSRGCNAEEIVGNIAITAVQAQAQ